MALSTIQIGRIGQAYAKKESIYGTVPSLTAAEAFRHKTLTFPGSDVKNKRTIIEKQQSPFTIAGQRTSNSSRSVTWRRSSLRAARRPGST